jgi:DNA topoisomerase-3
LVQGVTAHLQAAAAEADWLFLWLDCDREGENICYEVLLPLRGFGYRV